jgi:hypothetical protein
VHPKGAEATALRRNIMIESRKRFLGAPQNEVDELLCSWVYHTRLFGGLFIPAFASVSLRRSLYMLYSRKINPAVSNFSKTFYQTSELKNLIFGDGYLVMKRRFTFDGR